MAERYYPSTSSLPRALPFGALEAGGVDVSAARKSGRGTKAGCFEDLMRLHSPK